MAYALRLAPVVQSQITEFISEFEAGWQLTALEAVYEQLQRLADDPRLGVIRPGPFGRPLFRFEMVLDGVIYYRQVVYRYSQDEEALEITAFGPVPL